MNLFVNLRTLIQSQSLQIDNPRDHLLFIIGINNGLRIGDLVKLKVQDVKDLKIGETVNIVESKTGKKNVLVINKTVQKALKNYLEKVKPSDQDYLFPSRRGQQSHTESGCQQIGQEVD